MRAQVWGTGVRMEILMRTLGLSRVADTKVGNALVRGGSGGERKRVTSAEMLVGPKVLALSNPSSFSHSLPSLSSLLVMTSRYTTHLCCVALLSWPSTLSVFGLDSGTLWWFV